ncbi:hypothetical protein MAXJ12_23887 [Mesorhizobium alhagi CCNWXJ12-2]|uniref:Uncharacterized protein n=1 Tax=Mesorhizobium alhagi CCNWXJ12-2 TaxID=1107882 RepID=H0HX58_9HYPH|nr:hypothetical protein MAXJ12_23887 [Mesorhizobium alhagi CCNWXJ12-2]
MIEHLQSVIAKMMREKSGPRSERSQRLLGQLELQLEDWLLRLRARMLPRRVRAPGCGFKRPHHAPRAILCRAVSGLPLPQAVRQRLDSSPE